MPEIITTGLDYISDGVPEDLLIGNSGLLVRRIGQAVGGLRVGATKIIMQIPSPDLRASSDTNCLTHLVREAVSKSEAGQAMVVYPPGADLSSTLYDNDRDRLVKKGLSVSDRGELSMQSYVNAPFDAWKFMIQQGLLPNETRVTFLSDSIGAVALFHSLAQIQQTGLEMPGLDGAKIVLVNPLLAVAANDLQADKKWRAPTRQTLTSHTFSFDRFFSELYDGDAPSSSYSKVSGQDPHEFARQHAELLTPRFLRTMAEGVKHLISERGIRLEVFDQDISRSVLESDTQRRRLNAISDPKNRKYFSMLPVTTVLSDSVASHISASLDPTSRVKEKVLGFLEKSPYGLKDNF